VGLSYPLARHAVGAVLIGLGVLSANSSLAGEDVIEKGKAIAFDRSAGNCLACHIIPGGEAPGTIGPPLLAMKVRFPEKAQLRAQIYDPAVSNPETTMPPFGKHGILTEEELDAVVEFIWNL